MTSIIVSTLSGGHFDGITALAQSDRNLASGSDDCTICLWSPMQSRSPINKISVEFPCTSIKFALNKSDLIFASHGGYLCSYDFRNVSSPLFNLKVSSEEVNSIDLLESEARIAAGDDTGSVHIVCSDSGQSQRTLKKHDNICSSVLFRPGRTWQVISGGLDSRLVVSDWKESGRAVTIFEMSELLDFSDDDEDDNNEEENESEASSEHRASVSSDSSGPVDEQAEEEEEEEEEFHEPETVARGHQVRIHASQSEHFVSSAMSTGWSRANRGMPVNPPMIHSVASSKSGHLVAVGLASGSVEMFDGAGKHLMHTESFYGHSRGVSALHVVQDDQFLVSGGNDSCLFVWPLATEDSPGGSQIRHSRKIEAIAGADLSRTFVTDSRPVINMMDLSLC